MHKRDINIDSDAKWKVDGVITDYNRIRRILEFFQRIALATVALFAVILSHVLILLTTSVYISPKIYVPLYLIVLLGYGWVLTRAWWYWQNNPIDVDAKSGVMQVYERGPLILGLPDSPPDTIDLRTTNIDTVRRNVLQRKFLFNCSTIEIPTPKGIIIVRNVIDVEHILAIQRNVGGLERKSTDSLAEIATTARESLREAYRQTQLLEDILGLLVRREQVEQDVARYVSQIPAVDTDISYQPADNPTEPMQSLQLEQEDDDTAQDSSEYEED